jgi:D-aminopeptidase
MGMRKTLDQLPIHDFFYYPRGRFNAITDVGGVKVGHSTVVRGEDVRTGVTVVSPLEDYTKSKLIAGGYVFNGNGEMLGLSYVLEEARLTSPIFLTNTYSVGDVANAVIDYSHGAIQLPIVGECWDGYLNDIDGRHVHKEHVIEAIGNATTTKVLQGNVGAGTGMTAFGFKAGIGTSSRIIKILNQEYTIGTLVNNNLGNEVGHHRYLRIGGVDIGKMYIDKPVEGVWTDISLEQQSSTIIVIATDIPLVQHQLTRIAKRAVIGMGRVGIVSYTGSGDFVIAFSTANAVPKRSAGVLWHPVMIEEGLLDDVFEAVIESVEESYINSLLTAEDMTGIDGHTMKALPIEDLIIRKIFPQPVPKKDLLH